MTDHGLPVTASVNGGDPSRAEKDLTDAVSIVRGSVPRPLLDHENGPVFVQVKAPELFQLNVPA